MLQANKYYIYDIKNDGEKIDTLNRKIHYIHSIENKAWIGMENNIISVYDEKCKILYSIIDFRKKYPIEGEVKIIHIDYDVKNNKLALFYGYTKMDGYIYC